MSIQAFFAYARNREEMRIAEDGGWPEPWTDDPILRQKRLGNVFREDDKDTRWFRKNIRGPMGARDGVVMATVIFRWFGTVAAGELILANELHRSWDSVRACGVLEGIEIARVPVPDGMAPLPGVCSNIQRVWDDRENLVKYIGKATTLEIAWTVLKQYPFLGSLLAYEIAIDLLHTPMLDNATDAMTWVSPGPGCARALGRIFDQNPEAYNYASSLDRGKISVHMKRLLTLSQNNKLWPTGWSPWEMHDLERTLANFDKYRELHELS